MHTLWLLAYHICAHLPSQQRVVSKGHVDSRVAGHRPQQHQNEKGEDAELALSLPCGPTFPISLMPSVAAWPVCVATGLLDWFFCD